MASNEDVKRILEEIHYMKEHLALVREKVSLLAQTVSLCEKTTRLVMIANWDQLGAFSGNPPPTVLSPSSSPPHDAKRPCVDGSG